MRVFFALIFSSFFILSNAHAQATLPNFSASLKSNGKVVISWRNGYPAINQISIQRSRDSLRNFTTLMTVPDPHIPENGFVDSKTNGVKMYYRIFILLPGSKYVFTKSRRAVAETADPSVLVVKPVVRDKSKTNDKPLQQPAHVRADLGKADLPAKAEPKLPAEKPSVADTTASKDPGLKPSGPGSSETPPSEKKTQKSRKTKNKPVIPPPSDAPNAEPQPAVAKADALPPATKTADNKTSDTKTPDTKTSDSKTPDNKTPDTKTPDTKTPDVPVSNPRPAEPAAADKKAVGANPPDIKKTEVNPVVVKPPEPEEKYLILPKVDNSRIYYMINMPDLKRPTVKNPGKIRPRAIEIDKILVVKRSDSLIMRIYATQVQRFSDSLVKKTKDTLLFVNADTLQINPYVEVYKEPREVYKISPNVFMAKDGNVIISLADFSKKKYAVAFYETDDTTNDTPVMEVKDIRDATLTIDKTNFGHAGWFRFELYEDGKLKEKNKLLIPKE